MARNRKTYAKKAEAVKAKLRAESWPTGNPKAVQARWQLVCELARLEDVPVKEIKQRLKEGTL